MRKMKCALSIPYMFRNRPSGAKTKLRGNGLFYEVWRQFGVEWMSAAGMAAGRDAKGKRESGIMPLGGSSSASPSGVKTLSCGNAGLEGVWRQVEVKWMSW